MNAFYPLRMSTCTLQFLLEGSTRIPALATTLWRGILGVQLKRMSEGLTSCPALPDWLSRERLYEYFMETPPPPNTPVMRRYPHVPHPYVLLAGFSTHDQHVTAGQELRLHVRLFGRSCALMNIIILALARGAADGIGKSRAKAQLQNVLGTAKDGATFTIFQPGSTFTPPPAIAPDVPDMPGKVLRIRFETPLRLQRQGRILTPRTFIPESFLMNIVRRYAMLNQFHEGKALTVNFKALKQQAEHVTMLERNLRFMGLERYSARQRRAHPLGGLLGECVLDMHKAPDLWPFLWLGQYILAGKGTVFGLGQFVVEPL